VIPALSEAPDYPQNSDIHVVAGKTVGGISDLSIEPPVQAPPAGWLVVLDGPTPGRDHRLIEGKNRIGGARNCEIWYDEMVPNAAALYVGEVSATLVAATQTGTETTTIEDGDEFTVAGVRFKLKYSDC